MKFADSVKQNANLTSTTTITPGAVVSGFRTLTQAIADTASKPEQIAVGDIACFRVDDVTDPTKFEVADYTIGGTASAPTLTRSAIRTSSAGGTNPVTFGGPVTVLLTVSSLYLTGMTIGGMAAVSQSSIKGTDLIELEQSGVSGGLSVDTHYAYLVGRMQAAGLFTGGGTTPTEVLAINTIASPQTVGTSFTVSGTWTGVQPTSLDHASTDNGGTQGAWTTLTSAANGLVINANGTWSYSWTPSNASTSRTLQVRDTGHTTALSAQSNSYVVNAAAAAGSAYTMTPYQSSTMANPFDVSGVAVYSGTNFRRVDPASLFTGSYPQYFNIKKTSDGSSSVHAQCGWSLNGTASNPGNLTLDGREPALLGNSNAAGANSYNSYVDMGNGPNFFAGAALWIPVGFVGTASFWDKGDDGIGKKYLTVTITGA